MIMTFIEAVKFLESYIPTPEKKHPGELGLKRMQYLMDLLGNPQLTYPAIHIGGTSGKGSTATIIASILAAKYKVGLHTSPHLEKITERIITMKQLNNETINQNIPDDEFIALTNQILPIIRKVENSKFGKPSYFEIVTAMAFLYFNKQKVDFAVIEVGMGGRYDATNVIKPLVAVLTNVGFDHTEVLGDTVEQIAKDKVGIIKSEVGVVSGVKQASVIKIVKSKVGEANLSLLGKDFSYRIRKVNVGGSIFDYSGNHTYKDLKLSLLGQHQVENAALAIRAIEILSPSTSLGTSNLTIDENDIRKVLRNVFIPGRLEIVKKNPLVILDGAHNTEKIKALVKAITDIFPKKRVTAVVAIKADKKVTDMLSILLPICARTIFTKFQLTTDLGDTFSYDPEELLEIVRSSHPEFISGSKQMLKRVQHDKQATRQNKVLIIKDPIKALQVAQSVAESNDLILVTGSLYLVGEVRKRFSNDANYHSNVHE